MNYSQIICKDERVCNDRCGSRTAATSKMERFVIIVNGFHPLTIITKRSILIDAAVLDPSLNRDGGFQISIMEKYSFWIRLEESTSERHLKTPSILLQKQSGSSTEKCLENHIFLPKVSYTNTLL